MTPTIFKSLPTAFIAASLGWGPLAISAESNENLDKVRARVSEMFSAIEPEDIKAGPIDGWFKIQKGPIIAYVSDDGRYLLQGDLIDLDSLR